MPIRALVFDVGGVLIRTVDWSGRQKWETRLGLPDRGLSSAVFDSDTAKLASLGQASASAIWESIANRFHLNTTQMLELQTDFWAGDQINSDLVQFALKLRQRYRLALLSNAWPGWREIHASIYGLDKLVDTAVYSYEEGITKPEVAIFRIVCNRLNVELDETLFVDDFIENVEGARSAGMISLQFRSNTQIIQDITGALGNASFITV